MVLNMVQMNQQDNSNLLDIFLCMWMYLILPLNHMFHQHNEIFSRHFYLDTPAPHGWKSCALYR